MDNSRYQQQLSLSSFDVRRRDEINRIGNNASLYKPWYNRIIRLSSVINPIDLDWKDILEKLENIFRRKAESYSQVVDNFRWIKNPFVHDKGVRLLMLWQPAEGKVKSLGIEQFLMADALFFFSVQLTVLDKVEVFMILLSTNIKPFIFFG